MTRQLPRTEPRKHICTPAPLEFPGRFDPSQPTPHTLFVPHLVCGVGWLGCALERPRGQGYTGAELVEEREEKKRQGLHTVYPDQNQAGAQKYLTANLRYKDAKRRSHSQEHG